MDVGAMQQRAEAHRVHARCTLPLLGTAIDGSLLQRVL